MSEVSQPITTIITKEEIEKLFPQANTGRRMYVDPRSHQFVDEIIELWFQSKGYDFWDNPYPDIIEWEVNKDNEIKVTYICQPSKSQK